MFLTLNLSGWRAEKHWNVSIPRVELVLTLSVISHNANIVSPQRGLIRTPEDVFTIHPLPDRLRLEKNKTRAHVIHRRSTTPLESVGKALKIEKRSENWCGVEG